MNGNDSYSMLAVKFYIPVRRLFTAEKTWKTILMILRMTRMK